MSDFAQDFGSFLDTEDSMTEETFKSFFDSEEYNVMDSMVLDS